MSTTQDPFTARIDALIGLKATADYYLPETMAVFLRFGQVIDRESVELLVRYQLWDVETSAHGLAQGKGRIAWGAFRSAVAIVEITPGMGDIRIADQLLGTYFQGAPPKGRMFLERFLAIAEVAKALENSSCVVHVRGSSPDTMQQVKAVAHALANAVSLGNPRLREKLEREGFGGRHVRHGEST